MGARSLHGAFQGLEWHWRPIRPRDVAGRPHSRGWVASPDRQLRRTTAAPVDTIAETEPTRSNGDDDDDAVGGPAGGVRAPAAGHARGRHPHAARRRAEAGPRR